MNPIEQKKFDPKTGAEVKKAPAAGREPKPHPHTAGANKFLSPGAPRSYDGNAAPSPTPTPGGAGHQGLIDHILKAIGDFMTKPQETQEQSQANAAEKAKRAAAGHLVAKPHSDQPDPDREPQAGADQKSFDGHPGFQAVEGQIAAKEGIPKANAGAILASASRKASKGAKKANPNLKKVKG